MNEKGEKPDIIRPLSELETAKHINFYKEYVNKQRQNDPANSHLYDKVEQLYFVHNKIDPKCILEVKRRLVRVEYPGEIKNVDKAIKTLGGLENIEASVADTRKKLDVRFHYKNKYNKCAFATRDYHHGLLVKVTAKKDEGGEVISCDYDVEGVTVVNFVFNSLNDFQYLPLCTGVNENKNTETENIYHKILSNVLPSLEMFENDLSLNSEPFIPPPRFAFYDSAHMKLNRDPKYEMEVAALPTKKPTKISTKLFGSRIQVSILVQFKDKEIPTKPLESAVNICKTRSWDEKLEIIRELFEKRPIWSKSAVIYHSGISMDQSKILLPMVAYYFLTGPFRSLWVRYGYDPRLDSKSRIYQILDYRIRAAESSSLKVNAKRTYTCKKTFSLGPSNIERMSLKGNIAAKPKMKRDGRCYILRPNVIPPARQMLYQFCDVFLPEVQEMISRLPRYPGQVCDAKNGWLPRNFSDQCREIVNRYVLQAVQKELLDEEKTQQEKALLRQAREADKPSTLSNLDYCSQMLSNIKKGIYKKVNFGLSDPSTSFKSEANQSVNEPVELSSDEDEDEDDEDIVGELIQEALPERLEGQEEEEEIEFDDGDEGEISSSDENFEIDLQACTDVVKFISESSKNS